MARTFCNAVPAVCRRRTTDTLIRLPRRGLTTREGGSAGLKPTSASATYYRTFVSPRTFRLRRRRPIHAVSDASPKADISARQAWDCPPGRLGEVEKKSGQGGIRSRERLEVTRCAGSALRSSVTRSRSAAPPPPAETAAGVVYGHAPQLASRARKSTMPTPPPSKSHDVSTWLHCPSGARKSTMPT